MSNRCAVIQMLSTADVEANLQQAGTLLAEAAAAGARLAVLPENFAAMGHPDVLSLARNELDGQGPIQTWLARQAEQHGMWIVAGSLPLLPAQGNQDKPAVACLVYNSEGQQVVRYDKLHLFDASVADSQGQYRESDTHQPGNGLVVVDTPVGRLGLSVCYDLRFPGLFTALRSMGAEVLAVPSAFTAVTGAAHWHALLRARAIENQCFVLAPNQGGRHSALRETYGHSMIIDPWGEILVERASEPGCLVANLRLEALHELRCRMPVWEHRRMEVPGLLAQEADHD